MAKKIYDIKPPKIAEKVEEQIKDFLGTGKKKSHLPAKKHSTRHRKHAFPLWVKVSAGAGIILVVLAVYLFFKLPKADIQIWPFVDVLSFSQAITADKTASSIDVENFVIPAQYFEEEKSEEQTYSATGNASDEGKAEGTITAYNKSDTLAPVTLKAGTHFMSDSGKYFKILQKIVIPAGKKSGGKITPGSIDVRVEAAEGGDSYNIGPSKFVVPKLSGTAYYYSISGESKSAMTGGYASKVKKVTDQDIQQAKESLTNKLTADAQTALKAKISADYILQDSSIVFEVLEAESRVKAGTVAENFAYSAKVKAKVLVFKKADLEKIIKDYITSKMLESSTILEKSLKYEYTAKNIDTKGGKMVIDLNFSAGTYQSFNKNLLVSKMTGKTQSEIEGVISEQLGDDVTRVEVNFWPFWVTKAPKSQKVIKIDLMFE